MAWPFGSISFDGKQLKQSCFSQPWECNKINITVLRLLTHVGFLRQNGLILSEVFFLYGKEQES